MRRSPGLPATLLALAVLAGCAPRAERHAGGRDAAPAAGVATATPAVVPATADEIRARTHDRARVTLVNVWATWCQPCREEFPELVEVAKRRRADARLLLVSADFDDQLDRVREFLAAQGVSDSCFLKTGDDMAFINTIHPAWSGALPATLVFDRAGRLTAFWEGRADAARFESAIDGALAAGTTQEDTR